ncbi:MAG TPA: HNH endonuclease, partial [Pyrinomonadaceae bacterium]|nr:HNH endonuclease [Pyrinomonadaceae bacterium]
EYTQAKRSGNLTETIKNRYKHPQIKARLLEETSEKCAYCEIKISDFNTEIEHILPKDSFPEKVVEWENLTIACSDCNRKKLDNIDLDNPPINPFVDKPSIHLVALGPMIMHKSGDMRGEVTERLFKLNEGRLFERRKERLENLSNLLDKYVSSEGLMKRLLKKEIEKEQNKDKEFVFVVKAYIKQVCNLQ